MFLDRQDRERDRVGPAVDEHYRQVGRDFLATLGLSEDTTWRQVADQNIHIPQAVGREMVEKLMNGRQASQAARGRDTWDSSATARAMNRINPLTEARPDWKPAFYELTSNGESRSRSRSSTAGQPKLRLEHNVDVEPMLDSVYGTPQQRAVASARSARRSGASSTASRPAASSSSGPATSPSARSSMPPPLLRAESASVPVRTESLPLRSAPSLAPSAPPPVVVKREGQEGVASPGAQSKDKSFPQPDIDCRICISPIKDIEYVVVRATGDRQALLLCCNNSFHRKCIGNWWQKQHDDDMDTTCPLCKEKVCSYMTSYKYGHYISRWAPREYTMVNSEDSDTDTSELTRFIEREMPVRESSRNARVKREHREMDSSARVKVEGKSEVSAAALNQEVSAAALIRQQDEEYMKALADDILSGKVSAGGRQSLEEQQFMEAIRQSLQDAKPETQSSQKPESVPVPVLQVPVPATAPLVQQ